MTALLGAAGSSGKQGSKTLDSTSEQTSNGTQSNVTNQTSTTNQLNKAIEDPEFAAYRQALVPLYQQEYQKVQQPVYGSAQKADYLNQLNDLAQGSIQSLKGSLAGRGGIGSGAFNAGAGDIEQNRFNQAAGFFSQLPAMEEQRRAGATKDLLQMGMNFAGRAPISQQVTGTNNVNGTSNTTTNQTGTSKSNSTETEFGPGFWKSLAKNMGGMGGGMMGDMAAGMMGG